MKSLLIKVGLLLTLGAIYIASPFATAWMIREAVRKGDSSFLDYAIEWPTVRETLKPAIARIALDLPDPEDKNVASVSPSLWQRIKAYWGQSAVDNLVEKYVTPEGLPQLFSMRKAYRDYISGDEDEAKTTPVTERIRRAWSRVKRAEFTGITTFEIDMLDKHDATRLYLGKMHLTPVGWKLSELRVRFLTTADSAVDKFAL